MVNTVRCGSRVVKMVNRNVFGKTEKFVGVGGSVTIRGRCPPQPIEIIRFLPVLYGFPAALAIRITLTVCTAMRTTLTVCTALSEF